jgi:uncharacterized protein (DUF4415 family)
MSNSKIVRYTTDELKNMPSESDWARAAAMTDEEILAAIATDPDEADVGDDWMERAIVIYPNQKQRVYALYDAYVVNYFKKDGRGYQARMNAVLKAYVDAQLAKEREKAE